ncbi:MAG: hypothetical protein K2X60_11180, partial [Xanthobacteraceae bacterium]|nr:hypothetical protein [Xanthobacteraceae bacterium]
LADRRRFEHQHVDGVLVQVVDDIGVGDLALVLLASKTSVAGDRRRGRTTLSRIDENLIKARHN